MLLGTLGKREADDGRGTSALPPEQVRPVRRQSGWVIAKSVAAAVIVTAIAVAIPVAIPV